MKKTMVITLIAIAAIMNQNQVRAQINAQVKTGAYYTGKYRNLFQENGHSDQDIRKKISAGFRQVFYGDSVNKGIYFETGRNKDGNLAYISDILHHDIRSEGMSYGMMIAVQLDKKEVFDALWNYAHTYMYIYKDGHPASGYFCWSVKEDGTPNAEGPAPDGEEYFVTALYMASGRWRDGKGIFNYRGQADQILTNMRHHALTKGPTAFGEKLVGAMIDENKKMILFVPHSYGRDFSDPSYHLPAFYDLWAHCGPKNERNFWASAADTSRLYFQKATHPLTGLTPDYADFEGKPVTTKYNPDSQNFAYDSWRSAMNWSVDWSWWQKDPKEPELSDRIQSFFLQEGIGKYGSIYGLDGTVINKGHASGLVATNAVVSLSSNHPAAKEFVEELWKLHIPKSPGERYYGGMLYLMGLLHCSGEFKAYHPR